MNEEIQDQIQQLKELKFTPGWELLTQILRTHLTGFSETAFNYALKGKDPIETAKWAQKVKDYQDFLKAPDELIRELTDYGKSEEEEIARRKRADESAAYPSL